MECLLVTDPNKLVKDTTYYIIAKTMTFMEEAVFKGIQEEDPTQGWFKTLQSILNSNLDVPKINWYYPFTDLYICETRYKMEAVRLILESSKDNHV